MASEATGTAKSYRWQYSTLHHAAVCEPMWKSLQNGSVINKRR